MCPTGQEFVDMKPDLTLNLGLQEYLTAVRDQPKPLIIPLCAELPLPDISPLDVYTSTRSGYGYLLESMEGSEKIARYSYIGIDPEIVITLGQTVQIQGKEPFIAIARDPEGKTPVDQIKSILSRFSYINVKAPRFFGGMVGYFAYDCVYSLFEKVRNTHICRLDSTGTSGSENLRACFMLTKDCIVFDHAEKKLYIFSSPFLTYDSDLKSEYEQSSSKILALRDHIAVLSSCNNASSVQKRNKTEKTVEYIPSISKDSLRYR
jgi:anthranilate synthase component 1